MISDFIYLDNASTTKVDDSVINCMIPYMSELYANPSSQHEFAKKVDVQIKIARLNVANLIGAEEKQIIFTSGATESINTILKGFINFDITRNQILVSEVEHSAVLETCNYLESIGFEIIKIPVDHNGIVDLKFIKENATNKTLFISVMLANNETGVIQPIKTITKIAKEIGSFMMTDATQAVGKIAIDVKDLDIDFLVFSGHKFHGPKGIGGFYSKNNLNNLLPLLHGGGQEKGIRSTTLNTPGIIGIGEAALIAFENLENNKAFLSDLQRKFENELLKISSVHVNGGNANRLPTISNINFGNLDADILIAQLENIYVSTGSACHSAVIETSHVLKAMGVSQKKAFSSIRFSFSKYNTPQEIEYTLEKLKTLI